MLSLAHKVWPKILSFQPINSRYRVYRRKKKWERDREKIDHYFKLPVRKKLHIGCGGHELKGWLNTDLNPYGSRKWQVIHLDATRPFEFNEASFEYVYSEHVIEHLTYDGGMKLLREAFRVLEPGGKIRISTPDLDFLVELYQNKSSELINEYVRWSIGRYGISAPPGVTDENILDTFVINNFVRAWGHQFIYNERVLRFCFEQAGFRDIERCNINEGRFRAMRGLENERRMPDNYLKLESLILEGVKPAAGA